MSTALKALQQKWEGHWEAALAHWSRFTRLKSPVWCFTEKEEVQEGLTNSFAMIRLNDHTVVISLRKVLKLRIHDFAEEILAHEIGHHVFCPADLTDHGRMISRMKEALPSMESHASMIANMYSDLLINDRLQRQCGLDIAGVYKTLASDDLSPLWIFYMRTFEILWSLPKNTLMKGVVTEDIEGRAVLASRIVRVYGKYWLKGAFRFAALCLPLLLEEQQNAPPQNLRGWLDLGQIGVGGWPEGLIELDGDEGDYQSPFEDPLLNNSLQDVFKEETTQEVGRGSAVLGGQKKIGRIKSPVEYGELLKELGIQTNAQALAQRYYRERAMPHLIRFPALKSNAATEKLPEGYQRWNLGAPLEKIDWFKSVIQSPLVVPGLTTVERSFGEVPGPDPDKKPIDLYIGIDCSGSMPNPAYQLSYPALAATIMALSAIRANAAIMACLSGEPGQSAATEGFVKNEQEVLKLLTSYLGTGYAYGIHRLKDIAQYRKPSQTPFHILVITDQDIFSMLDQKWPKENGAMETGWKIAEAAYQQAKAGATFVLNMPQGWRDKETERMQKMGWNVYRIYDWEELIAFARAFSQRLYAQAEATKG